VQIIIEPCFSLLNLQLDDSLVFYNWLLINFVHLICHLTPLVMRNLRHFLNGRPFLVGHEDLGLRP
jgi:hypothetical protein